MVVCHANQEQLEYMVVSIFLVVRSCAVAAAGTIVDEPTFPFVSVSLRTPRILLDMRSGDVANVLTMVNTSAFLLAIIGHWSNVVDWFADGYLQDGETDRAECILEHET